MNGFIMLFDSVYFIYIFFIFNLVISRVKIADERVRFVADMMGDSSGESLSPSCP